MCWRWCRRKPEDPPVEPPGEPLCESGPMEGEMASVPDVFASFPAGKIIGDTRSLYPFVAKDGTLLEFVGGTNSIVYMGSTTVYMTVSGVASVSGNVAVYGDYVYYYGHSGGSYTSTYFGRANLLTKTSEVLITIGNDSGFAPNGSVHTDFFGVLGYAIGFAHGRVSGVRRDHLYKINLSTGSTSYFGDIGNTNFIQDHVLLCENSYFYWREYVDGGTLRWCKTPLSSYSKTIIHTNGSEYITGGSYGFHVGNATSTILHNEARTLTWTLPFNVGISSVFYRISPNGGTAGTWLIPMSSHVCIVTLDTPPNVTYRELTFSTHGVNPSSGSYVNGERGVYGSETNSDPAGFIIPANVSGPPAELLYYSFDKRSIS